MKLLEIIFLIVSILICFINCRIHHLKLIDDVRSKIDISTFGYLKQGYLQAILHDLSFNRRVDEKAIRNSFTFIFEKTTSGGFSIFPNSKNKEDFCSILNDNYKSNNNTIDLYKITNAQLTKKAPLVIFNLDLNEKKIKILRFGNIKDLIISEKFHYQNDYSINFFQNPISNDKTEKNNLVTNNSTNNQTEVKPTISSDSLDFLIEDDVKTLNLNKTDDSFNVNVNLHFEIKIKSTYDEGLYLLHLYNCYNTFIENTSDDINPLAVNLTLELYEKNEDSYLSAGEMPVPILYLTWAILYFLASISWIYILKTSKGDVYKIHYLMLALVFIKSISLTFHAINLHYIALNGRHEAIWAILFYITYVLRGLLMITSVLLVGTGWTFIKHVLTENERRLFVIVVPLQILAIAADIFLEEKEEGEAVYITWRHLFYLLDLICCGAILFPIVWSIKHLEQASKTDGKAAVNLRKLKIFRHFYIMVICYIYFTRIISYLLKLTIPFRYEWLDKLCTESVTFLFFALTAYKFQPAVNNPYLQLSQDEYSLENDYDAEMNEVTILEKNPTLSSRKKLIDFDENDEEDV